MNQGSFAEILQEIAIYLVSNNNEVAFLNHPKNCIYKLPRSSEVLEQERQDIKTYIQEICNILLSQEQLTSFLRKIKDFFNLQNNITNTEANQKTLLKAYIFYIALKNYLPPLDDEIVKSKIDYLDIIKLIDKKITAMNLIQQDRCSLLVKYANDLFIFMTSEDNFEKNWDSYHKFFSDEKASSEAREQLMKKEDASLYIRNIKVSSFEAIHNCLKKSGKFTDLIDEVNRKQPSLN
jgi:hypothetical protein